MASKIATFSYVILNEGSGRGTLRDQGGSATIVYLIAYSDLIAFCQALRGGWSYVGTTSLYDPPEQHPNWSTFYCQDVSWEPVGNPVTVVGQSQPHSWEYAKVTASYGPPTFNIDGGSPPTSEDAVTEEMNFDSEVVTIPVGGCVTGSTPVLRPVKKINPLVDYRLSFSSLPRLPGGDATLIFSLIGKVNNTAFKGAAAGKMLFQGAKASRTAGSFAALNNQNWKVDLSFKYRDTEWNKIYDNTGALANATTKDGNPLYASANLAALLT